MLKRCYIVWRLSEKLFPKFKIVAKGVEFSEENRYFTFIFSLFILQPLLYSRHGIFLTYLEIPENLKSLENTLYIFCHVLTHALRNIDATELTSIGYDGTSVNTAFKRGVI